ncbi:MAG: hypothetical protein J6I56_01300 [Lachnospiraceae bacterium]|nr:hypothetical protein [Lachnospiraceae bacterium]
MPAESENRPAAKNGFSVRHLVLDGFLLGVLFAAKWILEPIANVELVTLLFILYARHIGKRAYGIAVAFTALESFEWGIHIWVIMYLYMWPLLITIVLLAKKERTHLFYCVLSALFGLFFGLLCSLPYLFIGGPSMAFTWWVAGIPFDILHCVSNFLLCLFLFNPIDQLLVRFENTLSA